MTVDVEVLEESALAMAQSTIQQAMDTAKIDKHALASRMGVDVSWIERMMSGEAILTVKTLARALAKCGFEPRFSIVPLEK